jgi:transposase
MSGRSATLPYQGKPTTLRITARRFFCRNPDCSKGIFCERLPDLVRSHAQSTSRLTDSHRAITLALGGEPGSRLAGRLGMPTSPDTLLCRIEQTPMRDAPAPRVLGVDDWAIRKGQKYGTILVDLEGGGVIDLLPGRDGATLRRWLEGHAGVEVISRDRATTYAQAASEAAPKAIQVADRWHLLKNVREMLERFFERHRGDIKAVSSVLARPLAPQEAPPDSPGPERPKPAGDERPGPPILGPAPVEQVTPTGREERFREVRRRHAQRQSIRQIGKEMRLSRGAVRRYLRQDHCPDWRPGQARRSRLDRFREWIDGQILAGRDRVAELHRELAAGGYEGSPDSVRRFVTKRLGALGKKRDRRNAARPRSPPAPSARTLAFDVLRAEKKRKAEEKARVEILRAIDEEFREVLALADEFIALIRKERATPLADWLAKAEASASAEMRGFAQGVRQDEAAVSAAMTESWSNGPVEGQVNRLKVLFA